jgi:hypothetical protein
VIRNISSVRTYGPNPGAASMAVQLQWLSPPLLFCYYYTHQCQDNSVGSPSAWSFSSDFFLVCWSFALLRWVRQAYRQSENSPALHQRIWNFGFRHAVAGLACAPFRFPCTSFPFQPGVSICFLPDSVGLNSTTYYPPFVHLLSDSFSSMLCPDNTFLQIVSI